MKRGLPHPKMSKDTQIKTQQESYLTEQLVLREGGVPMFLWITSMNNSSSPVEKLISRGRQARER